MKKLLLLPLCAILLYNCGSDIKNRDAEVLVEEGTEVTNQDEKVTNSDVETNTKNLSTQSILGSWVGYFERDKDKTDQEKTLYVDEGYYWNRDNKINISIDEINGNQVKGHSVVAGNDRPFEGTMEKIDNSYYFEVEEPGDDKYDGKFIFSVFPDKLIGKWSAFKKIDIQHRVYELEKKTFSYDSNVMLERVKDYIDWSKYLEDKNTYEEDDEFEEWITRQYASATNKIYEVNASNQLLTKEEVENLKKGDLTIIRNAIYARHGYSFKNRPMRVFFDAQKWYVPIHTDIKSDFTDIEKKNIELLLRYEKNAAEYYDHFGRG